MQDKYVRRRRTVLAVLVVVVLVLVVTIFGAAENSPLHPVQQGIAKVVRPIGKGASEVVSPVRDVGHWVSSTLHAKSEDASLRRQNATLDRELSERSVAVAENAELKGMLALTKRAHLGQDAPVYADVDAYNPQQYYETIGIDKGAEDGIKDGDPVVGQYGLVGKITQVGATTATVSGLNSKEFGVYSQVKDVSGQVGYGTLEPEVGHPLILQLNYVPVTSPITDGDEVFTATFMVKHRNARFASLYPAGIPIGTVAGFNYTQFESDDTVNVTPSVNMRNLMAVEVLTDVKAS